MKAYCIPYERHQSTITGYIILQNIGIYMKVNNNSTYRHIVYDIFEFFHLNDIFVLSDGYFVRNLYNK